MDCGFHGLGDGEVTCLRVISTSKIKMRTSNNIERLDEEIRRRERVIRIFPNEESLERLIGALQKEINDDWISRKYIHMDL